MTLKRFNYLLTEGALSHPLIPFRNSRLLMALSYVLEQSPQNKGRQLLDAWYSGKSLDWPKDAPLIEFGFENSTGILQDVRAAGLNSYLLVAEALKYVVDGLGAGGASLLEAWCDTRNAQDRIADHDFETGR